MAKKKRPRPKAANAKTQAMRRIANDIVEDLCDGTSIMPAERGDLETSLVRQWTTYQDQACLFIGKAQVYFRLQRTPLGNYSVAASPSSTSWFDRFAADWKISEELLPEIAGELNRGQSAEFTNSDGLSLRMWVNPRERSLHVESLTEQPITAVPQRNHDKIAHEVLSEALAYHLGDAIHKEEFELLAKSVVRQWKESEGHACLFLDARRELVVTLTEKKGGACDVGVQLCRVDLESQLAHLGISREVVPDVIARFNLGRAVDVRDPNGVLMTRLSYDPATRNIRRSDGSSDRAARHRTRRAEEAPDCCTACGAVLSPWEPDQRTQNCLICNFEIRRP